MIRKETQQKGDTEAAKAASEEVIYKIDIPANRYDMLCVEGIARALNVFKHGASVPRFRLADMAGRSNCKICPAKGELGAAAHPASIGCRQAPPEDDCQARDSASAPFCRLCHPPGMHL
jgi:hypothetical protein